MCMCICYGFSRHDDTAHVARTAAAVVEQVSSSTPPRWRMSVAVPQSGVVVAAAGAKRIGRRFRDGLVDAFDGAESGGGRCLQRWDSPSGIEDQRDCHSAAGAAESCSTSRPVRDPAPNSRPHDVVRKRPDKPRT